MEGMEDLVTVKLVNTIPLDIKTRKRMHFKVFKRTCSKKILRAEESLPNTLMFIAFTCPCYFS